MTLTTLEALEVATYKEIADHWNRSPKLAQTYVNRYCHMGFVERVNAGRKVARFQLTEKGIDLLEPEEGSGGLSRQAMEGERVVARAIRTQPASVWDLGRAV